MSVYGCKKNGYGKGTSARSTKKAIPRFDAGNGELCGYLAYLRSEEPEAFEAAVGRFGTHISEEWGLNGAALYAGDQRKYVGWITSQNEAGTYEQAQDPEGYNYF